MELAIFRQLVIEEKRWLDERHQWLCEVIMSPVFKAIEADEQDRLRREAACMSDLSLIYGERIAACGEVRDQENA